eukprot:s857_g13.t1
MVLKCPVASRLAAQQRDILAPEDSQGAPEVSGRKKYIELCLDLLENETVARDLAAKNPSSYAMILAACRLPRLRSHENATWVPQSCCRPGAARGKFQSGYVVKSKPLFVSMP